jgi:hypothetical protein
MRKKLPIYEAARAAGRAMVNDVFHPLCLIRPFGILYIYNLANCIFLVGRDQATRGLFTMPTAALNRQTKCAANCILEANKKALDTRGVSLYSAVDNFVSVPLPG